MTKTQLKWTIAGVSTIVAIILFMIFNPFVIIGAGQRGVVMTWGAVSDRVLAEGIHWRTPIVQNVVKVEVRTVKHEVDAPAYSKDLQIVDAKIALNYHISPERANKVFQEIGKDYEIRIIDPAIQESVKSVSAKFTAQELIEKREIVKDEIKNHLKVRLLERNILVDELSIVNFDFSEAYEKAIDAKQVAQQQALKAENDLKRIKVEAEQRVAQAQAEAEAIRAQSNAANNEKYVALKALEVQQEAIKKWDGKLPQTFVPGSALPFLNIGK
jgi:regulator of protease activity HflC (stomatin/prohibitin superfamily)